MDKKSKERVEQIAHSLKELHLASTMEEALKRAKEIVENAKGSGQSIGALMREAAKEQEHEAGSIERFSDKSRKELDKEAHEEHRDAEHNITDAKKSSSAARKTREDVGFDIKVHKLEKGDVKDAMHEVDEIDCATKDADYIIGEAKKVQKKARKK